MTFLNPPTVENQFLTDHAVLLNSSFQHYLGYPLCNSDASNFAETLFQAPFAVLSHNTANDPLFNYSNQQGLALFELTWDQLIQLPSRASVETVNFTAREKLMAQVTEKGFIKDYQGIRISSTGKRFQINKAIVWNLHDKQGVYQGQAACLFEWDFL
ncbi:MAG: MEKHLA domain-containing protein [Methylococcales bacterium]|nr:MEKHLA domain-containing protein [Methylococcales bacterium]